MMLLTFKDNKIMTLLTVHWLCYLICTVALNVHVMQSFCLCTENDWYSGTSEQRTHWEQEVRPLYL